MLRIRDVYPGLRIRIFSIPDQGSEFFPSRILIFYPSRIPDQGSKRHRIRSRSRIGNTDSTVSKIMCESLTECSHMLLSSWLVILVFFASEQHNPDWVNFWLECPSFLSVRVVATSLCAPNILTTFLIFIQGIHFEPTFICTVGYSDFHNLMGFTSKKMPNNIL